MSRAFSIRHVFQDAAEETGNGTALDASGLARLGIQVSYAAADSASASPSGSVSPSVSPSPSPSSTASPSSSKSPSGSLSPTISPSGSASPSGSTSPSASTSGSPSASTSPSSSVSRSSSPSASLSPSGSTSISPSGSTSKSASVSPSASPSAPPSGVQGNVYFECSLNGSEWYELPCTPIEGGSAVTMTAAPGLWTVTVSGLGLVRCRLAGTVLGAVTAIGIGTAAAS